MDTKQQIKCPACRNTLTKLESEKITIDVCQDGCGGIWFDNYELKKFDEKFETAGEILVDIRRNPEVKVNLEEKRKCPVCPDSVLMRHFYSVNKSITVDDCPTCRGIWLDTGELKLIREEYESDAARHEEASKLVKKQFETISAIQKVYHADISMEERMEKLDQLNLTPEEKQAFIANNDMIALEELSKKSDAFAKMFPFLYLSWYIPGKQKWGNF